jgi:hypothetical protein
MPAVYKRDHFPLEIARLHPPLSPSLPIKESLANPYYLSKSFFIIFFLAYLSDFTSPMSIRFMLGVVNAYIRDIKFTSDKQQAIPLYMNIFPFQDFQLDERLNPLFIPQQATDVTLTLLSLAAYEGKEDIVKVLLAISNNRQTSETTTMSPLSLSLLRKHRNIPKVLFDHGADPDPRGESCTNGLHTAARGGLLDLITDFICRWQIPPDYTDTDGATPVMHAFYLEEKQAVETISLLFSLGASPNMTFKGNCALP